MLFFAKARASHFVRMWLKQDALYCRCLWELIATNRLGFTLSFLDVYRRIMLDKIQSLGWVSK